jgi:translation initiation factor 1 (eIF-1/SUI1)
MKKRKTVIIPAVPMRSSLGARLRECGVPVADERPQAIPTPPQSAVAPDLLDLSRCAKLIVRCERKGHGGKTVTVIDGLNLSPAQLDAVARRMRKGFGCGSWVAGGCVVLQGDFGPAAAVWLRRQGAARVAQAN